MEPSVVRTKAASLPAEQASVDRSRAAALRNDPMSTYTATIRWSRTGDGDFAKGQYSRAHEWAFDGGALVPASASPHVVPAPWSDPAGVDPEEAFVASLSSCHMLFFVDFARRAGFVLDSYVDEAEGVLDKRADGKIAMTRVTLRPRLAW